METYLRKTPYDKANPKVEQLNNMLTEFICREGLPFRLLDSPFFKAFIAELDPRYELPTRQWLSAELMPSMHNKVKANIESGLRAAKSRALTTDMWTSSSNDAYMGVTCHYIDADFNLHNKTLAVKHTPGKHDADAIAMQFKTVLDDFGMANDHVYAVTDSGANVKKAMTTLLPQVKWRPCFAHTLQLVVNASLNHRSMAGISHMLAKARSIAGHYRRSPTAMVQLQQVQRELNAPVHRLLQDVSTRWNSQVCR
jgi:hypothetical protein